MTEPAAAPEGLPLGHYTLVRPIAKGAMGEVWEARHTDTGVPLAVKCLRDEQDDWAESAFRNEVRATAALDHPSIVAVYDEGAVPEETAAASEGRLVEGRPYLVMELVDGKPLQGRVGRLGWPVLQDLLLQLLDALAHSHARGVIHRDLKPGNVLVSEDGPDGALRARLTDFGLAQALDQHAGEDRTVAGTPAYMAPEQLQGDWRDQGSWTDLYSLGCMAWALTTGSPPFGRKRAFAEFCQDHLHRPPPELSPRVAVPLAFEGWLRRLLCKDPADRYTRAADAADALRTLSEAEMLPAVEEDAPSEGMRLPGDSSFDGDASTGAPVRAAPEEVPDVSTRVMEAMAAAAPLAEVPLFPPPGRPPLHRSRAGVPASWAPLLPARTRDLPGVGLGLVGLRTLPMVGRKRERDALWATLRAVHTTGRARCVVLRGPSGTGKSRLARWLSERASEAAGVVAMRAQHAEGDGPGTGIAPMVARHLRCAGMERANLESRTTRLAARTGVVAPDEAPALAELIQPATEAQIAAGARVVRFRDPRERHVLVHRVLQRTDAGPQGTEPPRTSIVWLDDAQWGADALGFARYVLSTQDEQPTPLLLVITAQEAALMERPTEAIALEDLSMEADVDIIEVGPLPAADHAALVETLLGGAGSLADEVRTRTAGSPLFAVQLVGDWVSRGLLEGGPDGVRLKEGELPVMPDDLHAVWQSRIDRLLEPFGEDEALALELAAVLGSKVDRKEWTAVCMRRGLRPDHRVLDRLLVQRLAHIEKDGTGWTFAHPMLRSSLMRRAEDQGRLMAHHQACATMLELRAAGQPDAARRVAFHLLAAGDDRDALPFLLQAAAGCAMRGDWSKAERLLSQRDTAMDQAGIADDDPARASGWAVQQRMLRMFGRVEEAAVLLDEWQERATDHGWRHALAQLTVDAAQLAHHAGRVAEAEAHLDEAIDMADDLGDRGLLATIHQEFGRLRIERGELEDAIPALEQARQHAVAAGQEAEQAQAWMLLGRVAKQQGAPDRAMAHFADALGVFERIGDRWGVASCTNELGEIARLKGALEEAEVHYRDALQRMGELGADNAHIVRVNLAIVTLEQGRADSMRPLVERALRAFEATGQRAMIGIAHLLLMACSAAERDMTGWDVHLQEGRQLVRDTHFVEQDIALIAQSAGDLADQAGWADRARGAWHLARGQWRALDRPDALEAVQRKLDGA
jgi:eukaryotic-like serine/threonine-protein kinase